MIFLLALLALAFLIAAAVSIPAALAAWIARKVTAFIVEE